MPEWTRHSGALGRSVSMGGSPAQEEVSRRLSSNEEIPVEGEPLGWDPEFGFGKLFPYVSLPLQVVDRVSFGHPNLPPNRLFWGDNLHVMRQLPSESIDLIYVDPPFFSGRHYSLIFGDRNEIRSFSDSWEGGMSGYLIWLNARLYEMKRLLKSTGVIYVHCDWHASHYIKVEMDKIFGYGNLINEIIWSYKSGGGSKRHFGKKHDTLLMYARDPSAYRFFPDAVRVPYDAVIAKSRRHMFSRNGKVSPDVWEIPRPPNHSKEWIGYPTQKPERLLERVIESVTEKGDTVADFFCGGGTTPAVAQRLGRRWIACDQSRVAVAMTAHRLAGLHDAKATIREIPDFTVEYWGIYEATRLTEMPPEQFCRFALTAFNATPEGTRPGIHGWKNGRPLWVGKQVTADEAEAFSRAVEGAESHAAGAKRGIMLAMTFSPDAAAAVEELREREGAQIELVPIDSPRFREDIVAQSLGHAAYEDFLTFVKSPQIEVSWKRVGPQRYVFDIGGTVLVNPEAQIVGVQWDFNHGDHFTPTPGCSSVLGKREPSLQMEFEFPIVGTARVVCRVYDDRGGAGVWSGELEVR